MANDTAAPVPFEQPGPAQSSQMLLARVTDRTAQTTPNTTPWEGTGTGQAKTLTQIHGQPIPHFLALSSSQTLNVKLSGAGTNYVTVTYIDLLPQSYACYTTQVALTGNTAVALVNPPAANTTRLVLCIAWSNAAGAARDFILLIGTNILTTISLVPNLKSLTLSANGLVTY